MSLIVLWCLSNVASAQSSRVIMLFYTVSPASTEDPRSTKGTPRGSVLMSMQKAAKKEEVEVKDEQFIEVKKEQRESSPNPWEDEDYWGCCCLGGLLLLVARDLGL